MAQQTRWSQFGVLITVFFFWGFVAASNDILIPVFKKAFDLTQAQSQLVSVAFYVAYTVGSLVYFGVSRGMRQDLLPHGIKVTQIAPGLAETEFSVVRFHGDEQKAKAPYQGLTPLRGEDIANLVWFAATLPPHVCINDLVVTPTAQANSTVVHRTA